MADRGGARPRSVGNKHGVLSLWRGNKHGRRRRSSPKVSGEQTWRLKFMEGEQTWPTEEELTQGQWGNNHDILKLLPHSLGVAYRGSSLVCHSVMYLAYSTACRVLYAVFLACIDDICVLVLKIIISKATLNIHRKLMLTQP